MEGKSLLTLERVGTSVHENLLFFLTQKHGQLKFFLYIHFDTYKDIKWLYDCSAVSKTVQHFKFFPIWDEAFGLFNKRKCEEKLQPEWFSKWELIKTQYELTGYEQLILAEQVFVFVLTKEGQWEDTMGLQWITAWIRKNQ